MRSLFLEELAQGLAAGGLRVARFEFSYMETRGKGPPDKQDKLLDRWREAIACVGAAPFVMAGKSMGGRMASYLADELGASALVCYGYPFHPPGRPEQLRTEHLRDLRCRTLIVQGERDPFGTPEEVAGYPLSASIEVRWVKGGHDFPASVAVRKTLEFLR